MALLKRLQSESAAMIPHQHYGLQNISKLSETARQACEFTSFLVIHPADDKDTDEGCFKLRIDVTTDLAVFTTYAFILQCHLVPGGFVRTCNYDPRVIAPDMAERVLAHFDHMIKVLTQDGDRNVTDISLVSPLDEQLIDQLQGPKTQGADACIHGLIHEQVQRHPNNIAVESWDGSLTYVQLWRLSSNLADQLVKLGVTPDETVLVCISKSRWQVVAVLAILLAGGAFVPIDPSHPKETIRRIIDSAQANTAVVMSEHRHLFPTTRNVVEISYSGAETDDLVQINYPVSPQSPAYVLYTSGSTGMPKGCIVSENFQDFGFIKRRGLLAKRGIPRDDFWRKLHFYSFYPFPFS